MTNKKCAITFRNPCNASAFTEKCNQNSSTANMTLFRGNKRYMIVNHEDTNKTLHRRKSKLSKSSPID